MISEAMLKNLICVETGQIMFDPVVAADGYTYEREYIEQWLEDHKDNPISPKTGKSLPHTKLIKNLLVRSLIEQYLRFLPSLYEKPGVFIAVQPIKQLFEYINNFDEEGLSQFLSQKDYPCTTLLKAQVKGLALGDIALTMLQEKSSSKSTAILFQLHQGKNPLNNKETNNNELEIIKKMSTLITEKMNHKEHEQKQEEANEKEEKKEETEETFAVKLDDFKDVITLDLIQNPVILPEGHTLDASSERNLKNPKNPLTQQPYDRKFVVENKLAYDIMTTYIIENEDFVNYHFDQDLLKQFFEFAIKKNDLLRIKFFINKFKKGLLEIFDEKLQKTVLHILCSSKQLVLQADDLVWFQEKIIKIVDINIVDKRGNSPLHLAAIYQQIYFIELLMRAKANAFLKNNGNFTPLEFAKGDAFNKLVSMFPSGYLEISNKEKQQTVLHFVCTTACNLLPDKNLFLQELKLLKNIDVIDSDGNTPLHLSVRDKKPEFLELLLEGGANPNLQNFAGETPLIIAAKKNDIDSFTDLFLGNANPFLVDKNKKSALEYLSESDRKLISLMIEQVKNAFMGLIKSTQLAKILLSQKPYLLTQTFDNQQNSVLHLAAQAGNLELVKIAIQASRDIIDKPNANGNTALHLAAANGHLDVFIYLYKKAQAAITFNKDGETPIHLAVQKDFEIILNCGVDINITNQFGDSLLNTAVRNNNKKMVLFLLEHNIDTNLKNTDGKTALHLALEKGEFERATLLIHFGANPYLKDEKTNETLVEMFQKLNEKAAAVIISLVDTFKMEIIEAVKEEDDKTLRKLIDTHPYLLELQYGKENDSILQLAVRHKKSLLVKVLIEQYYVDPNKPNTKGENALHVAAKIGSEEFITLLAALGADLTMVNSDGDNLLHIAAKEGNIDLFKILLKLNVNSNFNQQGHKPLYYLASLYPKKLEDLLGILDLTLPVDNGDNTLWHVAATAENLDLAQVLQAIKLDPLSLNLLGDTPLHTAIRNNRVNFIDILLKCNFEIDAPNTSKLTALHLAITENVSLPLITELLKYGADPSLPDNDGNPALHSAVILGRLEVVKCLLENKVKPINVMQPNGSKKTALYFAMLKMHWEIFELLTKYHADIDAIHVKGKTLLQWAIKHQKNKRVTKLIEFGANLGIEDGEGKNALHLAVENNLRIDTIKIILKKGISINSCDTQGNTPLHLAIIRVLQQDKIGKDAREYEIIKFLLSRGADIYQKNKKGQSAVELVQSKQGQPAATLREIFEHRHLTLEKLLLAAILAKDYKTAKDLVEQEKLGDHLFKMPWPKNAPENRTKFIINLLHIELKKSSSEKQENSLLLKFFENSEFKLICLPEILPTLKAINSSLDELLKNDIRENLMEICSSLNTPRLAFTTKMFKSAANSELLQWFEKNKEKVRTILNSKAENRVALAKELYREIILLAYVAFQLDPKDLIASEVTLMHEKNVKSFAEQPANVSDNQP